MLIGRIDSNDATKTVADDDRIAQTRLFRNGGNIRSVTGMAVNRSMIAIAHAAEIESDDTKVLRQ